jgi:hypothetical protein
LDGGAPVPLVRGEQHVDFAGAAVAQELVAALPAGLRSAVAAPVGDVLGHAGVGGQDGATAGAGQRLGGGEREDGRIAPGSRPWLGGQQVGAVFYHGGASLPQGGDRGAGVRGDDAAVVNPDHQRAGFGPVEDRGGRGEGGRVDVDGHRRPPRRGRMLWWYCWRQMYILHRSFDDRDPG